MLFPLSKDFSSSSIFQKSGEHNQRPAQRVWTIDKTGSADRTKELHLLLTDQKPYKHHERLATKRANDGKKMDADRMSAFKEDLRDMYQRIDGEADERRAETQKAMRTLKKRNASSDSNLKQYLRDQTKDHQSFIVDMDERVHTMPPIWGGTVLHGATSTTGNFPREHPERTRARSEASKGVVQQTKDYKQMIKDLTSEYENRGPQEWTAVMRPSNEAIVKKRKAKGIAELTNKKDEYEAILEAMEDREHQRVLGERKETRKACRDAEARLSADRTKCLAAMTETQSLKKAELDDIQARVNGRGNGRPEHPEFNGYCTAGYKMVHKSSTRLRDHAAERADKDANHEESAAKTLCLSMPLSMRNQIVAKNHPRNPNSLQGTGIANPMDWSEMNWTQRWALLNRHGHPRAVQKAQQKAGVDAQGGDLGSSGAAPQDQRTLSPRTLGLATS